MNGPIPCPSRTDGAPHCWHINWVTIPVGRDDCSTQGDGQICCWCGERAPLGVVYAPPVGHGPHTPKNYVTQQRELRESRRKAQP